MKSIHKEHHSRLKKVLAAAYREKEKTEVGELWQVGVMGHIGSLGLLYPRTSYLELFGRLVWRLAPAACVLILLMGVAVTQLDLIPEYEIVNMFMEDPADFSLMASFE
jgi:hypothetical protein